jgi:hypothetical protein
MPRDLTRERIARELREIDPDPKDWWEGPGGPRRAPLPAFSAWGALCLGVGMTAVLAVLVVGFLYLLRWMAA